MIQMPLRWAAARMLRARSRRLNWARSTTTAIKTPIWKAIQNQIFVGTGVGFHVDACAAMVKRDCPNL